MTRETQQSESPYAVKIETATGKSTTVPIAFLTPKQLEDFLQTEFKRLAKEAGVKGARVHVERTVAADYELDGTKRSSMRESIFLHLGERCRLFSGSNPVPSRYCTMF